MVEPRAIAANAAWKARQELAKPAAEINRQAKNRSELDHDGKHLPVTVPQINAQQRFRDAQVCGGTHGKKFRYSLNHPQQQGN